MIITLGGYYIYIDANEQVEQFKVCEELDECEMYECKANYSAGYNLKTSYLLKANNCLLKIR